MANISDNPLISTRPSDSGLHVALHPLVLLTISDYTTRHTARQQQGPIVGALLGQQQGRQISLEHAFECHTKTSPNNEVLLDEGWFSSRVRQFKDVHKDPPLDIVGWFTIAPDSGPSPHMLSIHRHVLQEYNESAVLLAFHPSQVLSDSVNGAKLPLTVYESIFEGENVADANTATRMGDDRQPLLIRFRELPYSIETGEAEMISVDFVARGAGNAMAVGTSTDAGKVTTQTATTEAGGSKLDTGDVKKEEDSVVLSPENEEFIANLSTRLNAVKTLESRIRLIRSFLETLPSSDSSEDINQSSSDENQGAMSSGTHSILRNIFALISGLSLLTPQNSKSFAVESLAQENDVALISLLGRLGENVKSIRELGKKSAIVETGKQQNTGSGKGRKPHLGLPSRFDDELRESGFANINAGGSQLM